MNPRTPRSLCARRKSAPEHSCSAYTRPARRPAAARARATRGTKQNQNLQAPLDSPPRGVGRATPSMRAHLPYACMRAWEPTNARISLFLSFSLSLFLSFSLSLSPLSLTLFLSLSPCSALPAPLSKRTCMDVYKDSFNGLWCYGEGVSSEEYGEDCGPQLNTHTRLSAYR